MAILNTMYAERDELRHRMDRASCRDEYEYFRNRLYELERREMGRMRDMHDMRYFSEAPRVMPAPPPLTVGVDLAAPAKPDPLSFLLNANKKLLLGATS